MLKQITSQQLTDMMAYWYLESGALGKQEEKKKMVIDLRQSFERYASRHDNG